MGVIKTERRDVPTSELEEHGITKDGIAKLRSLRDDYPFPEHTENNAQFDRLRLLRWQFQERRIPHQDVFAFACKKVEENNLVKMITVYDVHYE